MTAVPPAAVDPPPGARHPLLWRLSDRVVRDHGTQPGGVRCASCGEPWPCPARRLGERGLRAAGSPEREVARARDMADPANG